MRADRLVSILMLLQRHGQISARTLAETLEVSVRTIYRDMDALSAAGIPVYAARGVNGGCCLVENYRTELTGMTTEETRALLLLAAPGPLDSLEVGQTLKAALRKLYAALPRYPSDPLQERPRITLDWSGWGQRPAEAGRLGELYRAVNASRVVKVIYRLINDVEFEQDIRPLGLVAKAGVWYLVWEANGKVRHYRVAGLLEVEVLEERFTYPADFDLQAYWEKTCAESEAGYPSFKVVIWASTQAMPALARQAGEGVVVRAGPPDNHGRQRLELAFESLEAARQRLLGLGRAVEVLEPESLRLSLADFARQIVQVYDEHE